MQAIQLNNGEFAHRYFATEDGQIWDGLKKRFLKINNKSFGYVQVRIVSKVTGKYKMARLHRAILSAFSNEFKELDAKGFVVDHIDGKKLNNHVTNLRQISQAENLAKAKSKRFGLIQCTNRVTGEKFICTSQKEAERKTGVKQPNISNMLYEGASHSVWHFERVDK